MLKKVYFRVDGSSKIGFGHLVRCLALSEILREDFSVSFFCKEVGNSHFHNQLSSNYTLELIESENEFICELDENIIVVLDGYQFDTGLQKQIKKTGAKLVAIDDEHKIHFLADVIINYGPEVKPSNYSCEVYTKLLLGLNYVLLREPFRKQLKKQISVNRSANNGSAFVSFGGSDPGNLSYLTTQNLLKNDVKEVNLVVGSNEVGSRLKETFSEKNVNVFWNLSGSEMLKVITRCSFAVVPTSTVLLEVFSVGMPTISGYFVSNQARSVQLFEEMGLIYNAENLFVNFDEKLDAFLRHIENNSEMAIRQRGVLHNSQLDFRIIFKNL